MRRHDATALPGTSSRTASLGSVPMSPLGVFVVLAVAVTVGAVVQGAVGLGLGLVAAPVATTSAPPVITVDPAALAKAARATVTAPATIMPAYRDSGTPVVTASRTADDDPDSQILPQWRDSGKPLQP